MSPLPCGLSRDHRPRYVSGTPRPYAGGRIWIGRFSSLPCARRNGRASASLTARGGGLPIGVTLGFRCHQAKSAGKRFILGQRDGFGGHVLCQPGAFLLAIPHNRFLHLAVDLLLDAIGGSHKAIEAGEFEQQTHQANATGTHFRAHQMYPENETMQEGQPRRTLKKNHDGGMCVEALLVGPPGLQRTAGNFKRLGGLTQGEPLDLQIKILIEEFSTLGARPAWGAIIIAWCFGLDYGAHSDLLLHPLPVCCHGLGWRGRPLISTCTVVDSLTFLGSYGGQVAGPLI